MFAHDDMAAANQRPEPLTGQRLQVAADVLGHLASPTRLHLLTLLAQQAQDVNSLTDQVEASRSSVSQHLGRLRMVGLVRTHREGRRMIYRLTSTHLVALIEEALGFAGHLVHNIPHHDQRTPSPAAPMTR
ncbi:transcriptional regulator, ArsR family [Pseudonocardia ammonioxydans]|uniref:Transcriptional regulator, ArsR family n=1 Tax=Pseudonocardia ammonioxydans TaxID=260086 RepID=A0A1I5GYL7_PSUAM|nr:metalloregulator ArsR/SmtB family transcription factor [Pseudonocardia ammonioxydans]SFO41124.1 transcriptional regulator, ArsR family [Pseudonocardia ammonioxydans]